MQEFAIILIAILTIGYVGRKIYLFLTRIGSSDPCGGCQGCALHDELRAKMKGSCSEKDSFNP